MALAQYTLGDESMLTTLKGLHYPGPALLVMREMLPTPFDRELKEINQFLAHWGRAVNNSHIAEFRCHKTLHQSRVLSLDVTRDSLDCVTPAPAVRYKLEFDGQDLTLYVGHRAFQGMFQSVVGAMSCNVLDWQELGYLSYELEGAELHMVQLKRWQYRKLLNVTFNSPRQCEVCFGRNWTDDAEICGDCQMVRQPEECQICHVKKGRTIGTQFTAYACNDDITCTCRAHTVCWLKTFHDARLELDRERCEMCQKLVDPESEAEDDEEYYDAIEEVEEPAAKRRRLE